MEIPEAIDASGFCHCGAYAQLSLLSNAYHFLETARKALGAQEHGIGRMVEVVDGGVLFEAKGEPVIIQWAKKPIVPYSP